MASGSRTGYCHSIIDKDMDFGTAMRSFARGMGALITMRDDPMDAEIPEEFKPSTYHVEARDEALEELARLEQMTPEQLLAEAQQQRARDIQYHFDARETRAKEDAKLAAILEQAEAWECEAEGVKDFAVDQLKSSINDEPFGQCYHSRELTKLIRKQLEAGVEVRVKRLKRDVKYHTEEHEKEVERVRERNEWLRKLRESLPPVQAA